MIHVCRNSGQSPQTSLRRSFPLFKTALPPLYDTISIQLLPRVVRDACYRHHQGDENVVSRHLLNVCKFPPDYMPQQLERLPSST